ncbi:DUF2474 family protein [Nevskia sp.]|nr:DUF2474 family protein [Nevskia sp.]HET7797569.1 DUF2474 family protein [Nevskia sp.]
MADSNTPSPSILRRLAWFAAIWLASVAALAGVALLIRWAIRP